MSRELIKFLLQVGESRSKIGEITDLEIFDNLSKHNPYYQSEHEIENEKLTFIRFQLQHIQEDLNEIWSKLNMWDDE